MNDAQHPIQALPQGYRLQEYELVRVLGFGGFGMTYLGFDHNLNKAVAIKEYLPSDISTRTSNNSVVPQASQFQDDFEWGLERFLDEARTLARFDHRNIIKVYRFFEAHGTAYIVMEYAEGETLSAFLEHKGILKESELRAILYPLLDGLEVVHRADFLHRDIKPGNIIIRDEDNSPVLLDFGSARQAMGARSRSVTSIITPGYAPIEQYSSRGNQGPWTDIYALGSVCYSALTGEVPDDATDRVRNDPLIPVVECCAGQANSGFLSAIDWALVVDEGDRPQSISVWRTVLGEETPRIENVQPSVTVSVPAPPLKEEKREAVVSTARMQPDASPSERKKHTRGKLLAVVISVVAVLIVGIIYIDQAEKQRQELAVLEKQRQELAAEKTRLAAEQAEKQRQEQAAERARLAAEQAEKQRQDQEAESARQAAERQDKITRYKMKFEEALGRNDFDMAGRYVDSIRAVDSNASMLSNLEGRLSEARQRLVNRTFRDCGECPQMVEVPLGSFTMGSPSWEWDRDDDEGPIHRVRIDYRLAVGMYEVTFGEWDACVSAGGCRGYIPDDEGWGRGNHPVINVSWKDAQSYVSWLSQRTGESYRLLSESEWEYVARAGSVTARYWREPANDQCRYGNGADETAKRYNSSWTVASCDDGYYGTSPVGNYEANNFGLYDVLGNVWEWTEDCYKDSYSGLPADGSAQASEDCAERVLRGGAWSSKPRDLRSADRFRYSPEVRAVHWGFRVTRRF